MSNRINLYLSIYLPPLQHTFPSSSFKHTIRSLDVMTACVPTPKQTIMPDDEWNPPRISTQRFHKRTVRNKDIQVNYSNKEHGYWYYCYSTYARRIHHSLYLLIIHMDKETVGTTESLSTDVITKTQFSSKCPPKQDTVLVRKQLRCSRGDEQSPHFSPLSDLALLNRKSKLRRQ